jgi:hypothetical protein
MRYEDSPDLGDVILEEFLLAGLFGRLTLLSRGDLKNTARAFADDRIVSLCCPCMTGPFQLMNWNQSVAYHLCPEEPFQLGLRIQALRIYGQQVPTPKPINIPMARLLREYILRWFYSLALDTLLIDRSFPRTRLALSGSFIFRTTSPHIIK